ELEHVFEEQEDQVSSARQAAAELAEAERLEAALPDLEARGVEGLDRVRAAIAGHRATAEALVEHGNLRATTGIVVEGSADARVVDPDVVDPNVVDPDVVDPDVDLNMIDPDVIDPDVIDPQSQYPQPADPGSTDPDDLTPDLIDPSQSEPDRFEPKSVGPEVIEMDEPSRFDAPAEVPLDLDDAGADGAMNAPMDDFAADVVEIAELEADLDGLADF
ncbi:MAG: hypothetical protein Q7V88_05085, partial [Actinomycetota bacterium]|nr:hypothetical protein [Actinomycetota bacterium]